MGGSMLKFYEFLAKKATIELTMIPQLVKAGFKNIAYNMSCCGDFKRYKICSHDYTAHFAGANVCRERICPLCQKKRSMLYFARFVPAIKQLLEAGYYVNFMTLTMTNNENLKQMQDTLKIAFRYLQHDNKVYRKIFKKSFVGGVYAIEEKMDDDNRTWHVHLHALVVKDHFSKDYDWLAPAWNECCRVAGGLPSATDASKYGSVDIKGIYDKTGLCNDRAMSVEHGCLETFKYITKFDFEANFAHIGELITATKGVRMINSWGVLRKISTNVDNDIDKSFDEIYKCCCTACGGTDFMTYVTPRTLHSAVDFKPTDYVKVNASGSDLAMFRKGLSKLHELKPDLKVGELYGGVLYTDRHAELQGQLLTLIREKDGLYYKYNYLERPSSSLDGLPLVFSKEMLI